MNEAHIRSRLYDFVQSCGGQKEAAKALHISQTHISLMLSGKRHIPDRIARKFGYKQVTRYERVINGG